MSRVEVRDLGEPEAVLTLGAAQHALHGDDRIELGDIDDRESRGAPLPHLACEDERH
jgi:hypothetical protein